VKKRTPKLIDALSGEVIDADVPPSQIKLNTVSEVRREAARVYRDCRQGRLDTADGSRLSYMLASIAKMIETSELEQRIRKLEEATDAHN